jgi:Tol biopolymer transport system component/DNA-binding winged helix-turn-helix (wHTH) protein
VAVNHNQIRFGVFELRREARELLKHGVRIKLEDQPFEILTALLEKPGDIVTRGELRARLWPEGTFVDFDKGLTKAVNKIRTALDDSPTNPRFIETLSRRGYRFIAPVRLDGEPHALATTGGEPGPVAPGNTVIRRRLAPLLVALLACVGVLFVFTERDNPTLKIKPPVPLVSTAGEVSGPSFSPDGSRVAYHWASGPAAAQKESGIYVKQVRGGSPVRRTRDEGDFAPTWSPDDRYIAFGRYRPEGDSIQLVPSIGGPERRIAKADLGGAGWWQVNASGFSWTPDAKWLVVSTRESPNEPYGIWLLSVDTGERHRLLAPPAVASGANGDDLGDVLGVLSPDGRVLVFARSHGSYQLNLYSVRLTRDLKPEGGPQLLLGQNSPCFGGIAWANNRDIVYSFGWTARLWRMRVGARSPELLTWAAPGSMTPAVAPAQHLLAYAAGSGIGRLWRMDLRTGERRVIVDSRYSQQEPQYSPDGRRVAFQSNRTGSDEVWTCDVDGANCQQLTFLRGPTGGTPRWSPDGRWMAFDSRESGKPQIYVISSDGGKPRRVTGGGAQNMIPSWSRDGKCIYFDSDRSGQWRIWKAPAEGGSAVQVTHNSGGAAFESVDGKYLYFAAAKRGSPLFRMPVAGGPEVEVAPRILGWESFGVTAKGAYFLSDLRTLRLFDAATGKTTTVAKADKYSFDAVGGISVSPDDAYVIFADAEGTGSDLMLVENFR